MRIVKGSHQIGIAILRIVVGVIFLWAGLEKVFAAEPFSAAGFLQFGTGGSLGWPFVTGEVAEGTIFNPTHDLWVGLATNEFGVVNQHLTYALVTAFLGLIGAGNYFGMDRSLGESTSGVIRRWLLSGNPHTAVETDHALEPMPA